jgi:hypothetical protein
MNGLPRTFNGLIALHAATAVQGLISGLIALHTCIAAGS